MLATHGGVHGAAGGVPVEHMHDILHCDAATNFQTFRPKSSGGARVMVDGKDVRGKLTKADFTYRHNCAACCMTKMMLPWVQQKAVGYTADSNAMMALE